MASLSTAIASTTNPLLFGSTKNGGGANNPSPAMNSQNTVGSHKAPFLKSGEGGKAPPQVNSPSKCSTVIEFNTQSPVASIAVRAGGAPPEALTPGNLEAAPLKAQKAK
jgi:hypothetical protein